MIRFNLPTIAALGLAVAGTALTLSTTASAHVTVKPTEAAPASFQVFTVSVPNEKAIPTTEIKLLIPKGLEHVTPTQKPGWDIKLEKNAEGNVSAVTWTGGKISEGFRDELSLSAKLPDTSGSISWKAYQTYADGTVVAWDQSDSSQNHDENKNSGPASVTEVKESPDSPIANNESSKNSAQANTMSEWSLYIAVVAIVVALTAIFFSTRKS